MRSTIIPCPVCSDFGVVKEGFVCSSCGPAARIPYAHLKETREADRKIMLRALQRLCDKFGIPYEISHNYAGSSRAVAIGIRGSTGLSVTLDFDGKSCQPNVFVVSWHMMTGSRFDDQVIREDFCFDLNPFHKRKATEVYHGFAPLLCGMSIRLQRIAEGTATENKKSEPAGNSGNQ